MTFIAFATLAFKLLGLAAVLAVAGFGASRMLSNIAPVQQQGFRSRTLIAAEEARKRARRAA